MPSYCANCGSEVEGRFCAKCGSAVAGGAPPVGVPQPQTTTGSAAPMADNVASALAYVLGFITGIIFLLVSPYNQNRTVRFHAFQAIFLHVAAIAISIFANIVFAMLPISAAFFSLLSLFWLAMVVLWIYMIVSAYQGKRVVLPVIGELAAKQA